MRKVDPSLTRNNNLSRLDPRWVEKREREGQEDHDSRLNLHFNYITFDGGINFIGASDRRNSDIFDGSGACNPPRQCACDGAS